MKKFLLAIIIYYTATFSVTAQTLYGVTFNGGNRGGGTIDQFVPATNILNVPQSFESFAANPHYTNLIQGANGKLYGMTALGGNSGAGVIFSYDPSSAIYTMLKDFDNENGAFPQGSLVQASDGKLYGMTFQGGSDNAGVIFSFDPANSIYTRLVDFDTTNGANPSGSLVQGNDGKLYGMTNQGGALGSGVIFSYDPASTTYAKLKDFGIGSGAYPYGDLVQTSDGKFFGMTFQGGMYGYGAVFSFDPVSSDYVKVMDFDSTNGANPSGSFSLSDDGKLYGMTQLGGGSNAGVIFSFEPSTASYTKLKDLDSTNGANPQGNLIQAADGKLYGVTYQGGGNGSGVIFSIDPATSVYTNLKDFDNTEGGFPQGGLLQASDGKLYGLTLKGGISSIGIIFSYDPQASAYAKLKDFGANINGSKVSASLLLAGNGKLYGMTVYGGTGGNGIIFCYDPVTNTYTKLKDFDKINGANPYGNLVQASDGKLYGMTAGGGTNGYGVIFSFDPSSSVYTKLSDFDSTNGANPYGGLIQANDVKLYGMTTRGGSSNYGVIFSFDPASALYTKIADFDGANGGNPNGNLLQADDGQLYGMTLNGGNGRGGTGLGVIFSLDPSTLKYTKLQDCDTSSGANPYGSLIQATDGNIYGMTSAGGENNYGVIFSYSPSAGVYNKLTDFDETNGATPYGSFLQTSDGKLYGMTANGGSNTLGVIFSYTPSTATYTKLLDFNGINGANPFIGSAFVEGPEAGPLPVALVSLTGKNSGNSNQLTWKVDNEQHLDYYQLERSVDGQNFKEISQIKATGNNSYSYTDLVAGGSFLYYYRLKSLDKDGHFKYSIVIKIRTGLKGLAVVTPNPFRDKLIVNIESPLQQKVIFMLSDLNGRKLYRDSKVLASGSNIIEINEAGRLSKGTYLLTIIESGETQSIKVVKGD
ncbi:MAG: choice-of-anchor tandem repeat GloVer-containing protein [Ginsengibacter sp.]